MGQGSGAFLRKNQHKIGKNHGLIIVRHLKKNQSQNWQETMGYLVRHFGQRLSEVTLNLKLYLIDFPHDVDCTVLVALGNF